MVAHRVVIHDRPGRPSADDLDHLRGSEHLDAAAHPHHAVRARGNHDIDLLRRHRDARLGDLWSADDGEAVRVPEIHGDCGSGWRRRAVGVTTEYVYDVLGRTAGTKRTGDTTWSCVTYDARGRVSQSALSAYGPAAGRTATSIFAVGGNPLGSSVTDPVGTITATSDLLGRSVTSTDVWGTVTTPSYEVKTGRVLSVTVDPAADAAHTQAYTYDHDGKVETVSYDGKVVADPTYASTQLLQSVAYLNGTSLSAVSRDANTGASLGMTWSFPSADIPARGCGGIHQHIRAPVRTPGPVAPRPPATRAPATAPSQTHNDEVAPASVTATRTITGLTVGRSYTFDAWVNNADSNAVTNATIGVDRHRRGDADRVTRPPGTPQLSLHLHRDGDQSRAHPRLRRTHRGR